MTHGIQNLIPSQTEIKVTSNIYLIAAYLVNGGKIVHERTDREDPRHVRFTVEGKDLSKIDHDWYEGCPLKDYADALKDIKSLIHG